MSVLMYFREAPKGKRVTCKRCRVLRFDNVVIHEIGCPNAQKRNKSSSKSKQNKSAATNTI